MSGTVVAILAITVLTATPVAIKGQKAELTDVENGCGVETYLTALDEELARRQESLNTGSNPLSKQRQTYAIAAAAEQEPDTACLLAAVAAAAAAEQENQQSKLQQAQRTLHAGRQALAKHIKNAAVAAALEQITFNLPGKPAYQHDATHVSLRLQAATAKPSDCSKPADGGKHKLKNKQLDPLRFDKIPAVSSTDLAAALKDPAIKLTVAGSCATHAGEWKSLADATTSCTTTAPSAWAPAVEATVTTNGKANVEKLSVYKGDKASGECKELSDLAGTDDAAKQALKDLCTAIKTEIPTPTQLALSGPTLKNNKAAQAEAAGCFRQYASKTEMTATDTANLEKLLEAAYTDSTENFSKKFRPLVEKHVQVLRSGKVQSVTIETINTAQEEHDALARLRAKEMAAKLASSQNPATPDQKESADKTEKKDGDNKGATANCTTHSTQDACTKGQNCK
uniref:Variant surface glycoprotein 1125.1216 n=1 Tax=Trypanosoma brucei TaxID=5691 RepID=A0A1J0R6L1_9TRYP|nr:variant surface glycoprotein 1125.1216 [Trypanosoma brucei]